MSESVFDAADKQPEEQAVVSEPEQKQEPAFQIPEELTELIGEGKKYKSIDDALKSVPHAQNHISILERELAELKQDLEKRLNSEQVLEKILEAKKDSGSQELPPNEITPEALKDLVKSTYQEISSDEKKASNLKAVDSKLQETWGDKAAQMLRTKADELGVGVGFLQETAAHSPKAFYNLIGVSQDKPTGSVPSMQKGSVNTETFAETGLQPYSYKWYQNMRRNDPKQYYTPKVQMQMHKHATEQGDKFYQ